MKHHLIGLFFIAITMATTNNANAEILSKLECDISLKAPSSVLIRRIKEKIRNDTKYAEAYKKLNTTLSQAWNASDRALTCTLNKMNNLVDAWHEEKGKANQLSSGQYIVISQNKDVYDLDKKTVLQIDHSEYDWDSKPTWEDYLVVKKEYDKLSEDYKEIVAYYCGVFEVLPKSATDFALI